MNETFNQVSRFSLPKKRPLINNSSLIDNNSFTETRSPNYHGTEKSISQLDPQLDTPVIKEKKLSDTSMINYFSSIKTDNMKIGHLNISPYNKYKTMFEKFTFKRYSQNQPISIFNTKKIIVIIKGTIMNKKTQEIIGQSLSVIGDNFTIQIK